ncbi:MAG TPA: thiolase family protein [Bacteroidota bacterium]|nr:thiolase family protein [Bacteroidota bacterium]
MSTHGRKELYRVPAPAGPERDRGRKDDSNKIVFLSGTRTPFGAVGGAFRDMAGMDLAVHSAKAAIDQAGLSDRRDLIDTVIMGNAMHTSIDSHYGARHVALKSGLSYYSTALTVNRICWSGAEAIVLGAKELLAGEANVVLAGGYESTSQSPMVVYGAAWGFPYMAGPRAMFVFRDGLNDTFINTDMMGTAENLARYYGITRAEADEFALSSQMKAADARTRCRLSAEITPVKIPGKRSDVIVQDDENPKPETTLQTLSRLQAVKPGGVHTAGNSSGIVDGAAAVIMTTAARAKELGIKPIGELLSWGVAGVDPHYMGIGPVPASLAALRRAGMNLGDLDHIEVNEAFGGQYLAVERELNLDRSKVNLNGGAIAFGHPLGATGARMTVALLRLGGVGLASACIGGGQGGAIIVKSAQ